MTAVFEIRSQVFPEFDVVLRVMVAALFFRFSGSQHCGHVHCAYQYREHYHCMDPDCNYQVSVLDLLLTYYFSGLANKEPQTVACVKTGQLQKIGKAAHLIIH